METRPILVAIKCITYNHEPYIRQCLEGFVMQQTNFRFVAIVRDDASTDDTATIIKEYAEKYPDIIKPIYETENQYSKRDGSLTRIMNEAIDATNCKYIALCEGDDYWIDHLKLQKQVDFLETNPEYSMVHTAFSIYNEELHSFIKYSSIPTFLNKKVGMDAILDNKYRIQTMTVLYRRVVFNKIINLNNILFTPGYFLMSDTQLWCFLLYFGPIGYIEDFTSVYREYQGSACRPKDLRNKLRFDLSCDEMRVCVSKHFSLKKSRIRRYFISLIKYLSFDYHYNAKYNPYPFVFGMAKVLVVVPFTRKILIRLVQMRM